MQQATHTLILVQYWGITTGGAVTAGHIASRGTSHNRDSCQDSISTTRILCINVSLQEYLTWWVITITGSYRTQRGTKSGDEYYQSLK